MWTSRFTVVKIVLRLIYYTTGKKMRQRQQKLRYI